MDQKLAGEAEFAGVATPSSRSRMTASAPAAKAFAHRSGRSAGTKRNSANASAKPGARRALREGRDAIDAAPCPILVRVNARSSDDYSLDLDSVRDLGLAGVMLAKAETAADVEATSAATGVPVVALIETARGLAAARLIAAACARIAFGSIDFAADLEVEKSDAISRAHSCCGGSADQRPDPCDRSAIRPIKQNLLGQTLGRWRRVSHIVWL